jgi:hypothetical protein
LTLPETVVFFGSAWKGCPIEPFENARRTQEGEKVKYRRLPAVCFAAACLLLVSGSSALAKAKQPAVSSDDPTYQLYQLLDSSRGGKLHDFYLLADIYKDPTDPTNELQHVLLVDYDKSRFFGRFRIYVRSVGKLTPEQLKTYTPKQIYDFGEEDEEEFEKINPGPFGQPGDMYLRATSAGPLASAPITDDVRNQYDSYLTQYILPALKK